MQPELTGEVLDDRYRVIERVGEGAMGSVYRGERLKLGRIVAVKVMNDGIPDEASRKRFEREAMAMAKLEHPHCASVLDVGLHRGRPYVVMEFVSGQNLKELLRAGPLPIARAADITRQVLSGLSHAHEHRLIHRDIKPANIVLSQKQGLGDHVKILDFGLARFNEDTSNLTSGFVIGTPNYMAPEQVRGAAIDSRADLYACGVLLFELLTGTKPFHADDPVAICMQHLNVPPPTLASALPGTAFGALEEVVARALVKDPAQRFATADDFSRALMAAATRPSSPQMSTDPTVQFAPAPGPSTTSALTIASSPPPTPAARAPRKTSSRLAVAGIVIVALGGGAVFLATRSDAQPTPAAASSIVNPPPVAPPEAAAPSEDAVGELMTRATSLADAGRREAAIDLLTGARKTYPKDARLPYGSAMLYLDKMWWADGLKQARAAISLDPSLKADADLIKLVLRGFNTTKSYDGSLARFLREDVGDAAKPYMEDTAKNHPNPIVRSRATAELRRYR